MPYVSTPGARIWFTDAGGSGQPVVFVHPATGTSEIWADQVSAFARSGYRVVAYDRRGAGRSSLEPGSARGSHVSDLAHLVEHLDLREPHLVGAALGACDVLEYVVRHSRSVLSVVISNSYAGLDDPDHRAAIARLWSPELLALPSHVLELSPAFRGTRPDRAARWVAIHADCAPEADAELPMNVTRRDLEGLRLPMLVLAGCADLLAPPVLMERLSRYVPGAEFTVIHDSGHASAFERPDTWNARVARFFDEVNRRR